MNKDFWLGILISGLLSLVLGIVGALLTPVITSWYKGWGKTREAAREERERNGYAETMYYIQYPHKFTQFLIRKVIELLVAAGWWLMGSFMTLIAALTRIMVQIRNVPLSKAQFNFIGVMMMAGMILTGIAYAKAMIALRKTDRLWRIVNKLDLYLSTVPEKIRNHALEAEVLRMNKVIDASFD